MFRRRSSHKPSEAFLHAFRDRYGSTGQPERYGSSPATTPFLLGPPAHGAASSALTDSTTPNMHDQDHGLEQGNFDLGGYQKHSYIDHQLFDLDPNGLDLTFGGGWAPSPHGPMSASEDTPSATVLAGASALDTPTSISFSDPINGPHFPIQSSLSGLSAFNTFGMLQHMAPVHGHYQSSHHYMPNVQTFDPQDSMLHQQQHQQNALVGVPVSIPRSLSFPHVRYEQPARPATKAEREQEQFRFRVKLMAPTAMVSHEDDHPITYLNKRQPYTLTISDTQPPVGVQHVQYRTSIRVSFDDELQRAKPSSSWQLFREGRGQSEADERGSPELRAIEWVSPEQGGGTASRSVVQKPHKEFFDGFSVYWTPGNHMSGMSEASLQLRCNFLSTDFSHSKGVKGIPVRLCCKTEAISPHLLPDVETCYCKVKTFRDHGAERKLNNDRTHVEKNIDKLVKELEQVNTTGELNDSGKRRRSDSMLNNGPPNKKHRANSLSSASADADEADGHLEEKIRTLRNKMASGRDHSLLYLKGDDADDPDSHPPGLHEDTGMSTLQPPSLQHYSSSSTHRSINSPVSSSQSMSRDWQHDTSLSRGYLLTPASGISRNPSTRDSIQSSSKLTGKGTEQECNPQHLASPPQGPSKVKKQQQSPDGSIREWIDVVDSDKTYEAPPPPDELAVACFYVKPTIAGNSLGDDYFRAVYLKRRDCQTFLGAVCSKCGIDPSSVDEIVRPQASGQYIKIEDDTIAHLKEGQDMLCDFELLNYSKTSFTTSDTSTKAYRLKLIF